MWEDLQADEIIKICLISHLTRGARHTIMPRLHKHSAIVEKCIVMFTFLFQIVQLRLSRASFKLCKKNSNDTAAMWPATNTQHAVFCQISVSNLLWSAFAQSAQGCRFAYEIIITNLVHSHDWVHGIFLCLNGVWSLSGLQWYSVETELLFYGQQRGNIHLGHDELEEQLTGTLSPREGRTRL